MLLLLELELAPALTGGRAKSPSSILAFAGVVEADDAALAARWRRRAVKGVCLALARVVEGVTEGLVAAECTAGVEGVSVVSPLDDAEEERLERLGVLLGGGSVCRALTAADDEGSKR